jgi:hypothetical protein
VANFVGPSTVPSDYSATVNWGDGTAVTAGSVGGSGTAMNVSAFHTYLSPGTFTMTTTITDYYGSSAVAIGTAKVTVDRSANQSPLSGVPLTRDPVNQAGAAPTGPRIAARRLASESAQPVESEAAHGVVTVLWQGLLSILLALLTWVA